MKKPEDFRRYTELNRLLYLLANRKLTLLNPSSWDDKNDSHCLKRYGEAKGHESVLALCFVQSAERYHLWKVFADGTNGVRIKFRRNALLGAVSKVPGLRHHAVKYMTRKRLSNPFDPDMLPFVKRWAYLDEKEYRLVYGSKVKIPKFEIDIPPDCIKNIKLNPWLDDDSFEDVKAAIRKVDSCWKHLKVFKSSTVNNETWHDFADRVARTGAG